MPHGDRGLQAGKHVYVEKPCSHNPAEGVLLVQAQRKYGKYVQMGTQRRSSPMYIDLMNQIHQGLVGRAYYAKAWYSNTRQSIGTGKPGLFPPPSIGISGRGRLRVSRTRTTSSLTTGIGLKRGARVRRSITVPMRSTCAAGRWGWIFRTA